MPIDTSISLQGTPPNSISAGALTAIARPATHRLMQPPLAPAREESRVEPRQIKSDDHVVFDRTRPIMGTDSIVADEPATPGTIRRRLGGVLWQ